ncbi:MAG: sulfatase [Bacteroidales bacterium]|nr:sulfatase [Bacteroidales bacterium]MCB9014132.1 sulfatase [Bacteroidales bacterium]
MKNNKLWLASLFWVPVLAQAQPQDKPNIIIIFADDLGYGDLSCYAHPTIYTPNLDQMAHEGMRFTQFYNAACVCTPSRAGLLTGRLPIRSGMAGSESSGNVIYPGSTGGLPLSEITIAEALKDVDYQTAIIGKWHLGHLPQYLPLNQGFDYFFGIPYSNDMAPPLYKNAPELPLFENENVIESGPDQHLLTKRYTEKAINFIEKNSDQPFFLYYASNFPHTPLFASNDFSGKSKRGLYGDVVEELDWSVGEVLKTVKKLGLSEKTLVIFTSDNGPWLLRGENGGSAGLLRDGKGSTCEGGFRVPAIAWWPGTIKSDQTSADIISTMDLFPTIVKLAAASLPEDRIIDGKDISPVLFGEKIEMDNKVVFYYFKNEIYAIRKGPWKAHFITKPSYSKIPPEVHTPPLLYNIEHDPSEKYDVSENYPDIIKDIIDLKEKHEAGITLVESQLDKGGR